MCCFTGKVQFVSDTSIFARVGAQGNQVVIYSMKLKTVQEVAMVLPVPVKAGSGEQAMRFFDFSTYPKVFDDLAEGFYVPGPFGPAKAARSYSPLKAAPLPVVSVGAFDASYVPTIQDFDRLDARFRLPQDAWKKLPAYEAFGFAVFKLKAGEARVHPMAFSFPSANPKEVFFPTVHIHDGEVHGTAMFDHALYAQGIDVVRDRNWAQSPKIASQFVKTARTHGMIRPEQHVFRCLMNGRFANGDVVAKVSLPG